MSDTPTRRARKPPRAKLQPRIMDLYGCDPNGEDRRLWQANAPVLPIDRLETKNGWIKSGHYVIQWLGQVAVVHIGNTISRQLSVQFMDGQLKAYAFNKRDITPRLLGWVVVTDEQEARLIAEIKAAAAALHARRPRE